MPRPPKCRRVCHLPQDRIYGPRDADERETICMTVDEYETLRLIDREHLSQEECGARMHVARTTVQQIYASARYKLACMLVDGMSLVIEGGEYRLCDGSEAGTACAQCYKTMIYRSQPTKGVNSMKIAVTYENGMVYQHFGHTSQFKIYDIEDGKVISSQVVNTNGSGHGALAGILQGMQVDTLICGGIGGGARAALDNTGIRLFGGVFGPADLAVDALLEGRLSYNPDVMCNHHGEGHHHNHDCGSHNCADHNCGEHGCHH